MKRDMDLIRELLLSIEANGAGHEYPGVDRPPEEIAYHLRLMKDAGLIDGIAYNEIGDNEGTPGFLTIKLTWEGHEFLDAARSPEVWDTATEKVSSTVGSVSLSVLTAVLIQIAKEKLGFQ